MTTSPASVAPSTGSVHKGDEEWRTILSPEQFRVLREKGTEGRGKGEYTNLFDEGTYSCAGCATPLYKSTTKFDAGCGWPSFFDAIPADEAYETHPKNISVDLRKLEETCGKNK